MHSILHPLQLQSSARGYHLEKGELLKENFGVDAWGLSSGHCHKVDIPRPHTMSFIGSVVAIGDGRGLRQQAFAFPVCTIHPTFEIIVAS